MKITKKHVFFWIESFSQWYLRPFVDENGIKFNCAEQYMMYNKAILFNDKETADIIMAARHPSEQKKLGRIVKNYDQKIWNEHKYRIVCEGNMLKYSQNTDLLKELLETGERVLVEASPYDRIWGIGLTEDAPGIDNPKNWKGENLLGFALTEVRNKLINS